MFLLTGIPPLYHEERISVAGKISQLLLLHDDLGNKETEEYYRQKK